MPPRRPTSRSTPTVAPAAPSSVEGRFVRSWRPTNRPSTRGGGSRRRSAAESPGSSCATLGLSDTQIARLDRERPSASRRTRGVFAVGHIAEPPRARLLAAVMAGGDGRRDLASKRRGHLGSALLESARRRRDGPAHRRARSRRHPLPSSEVLWASGPLGGRWHPVHDRRPHARRPRRGAEAPPAGACGRASRVVEGPGRQGDRRSPRADLPAARRAQPASLSRRRAPRRVAGAERPRTPVPAVVPRRRSPTSDAPASDRIRARRHGTRSTSPGRPSASPSRSTAARSTPRAPPPAATATSTARSARRLARRALHGRRRRRHARGRPRRPPAPSPGVEGRLSGASIDLSRPSTLPRALEWRWRARLSKARRPIPFKPCAALETSSSRWRSVPPIPSPRSRSRRRG